LRFFVLSQLDGFGGEEFSNVAGLPSAGDELGRGAWSVRSHRLKRDE
jgi:hypothetical protein